MGKEESERKIERMEVQEQERLNGERRIKRSKDQKRMKSRERERVRERVRETLLLMSFSKSLFTFYLHEEWAMK